MVTDPLRECLHEAKRGKITTFVYHQPRKYISNLVIKHGVINKSSMQRCTLAKFLCYVHDWYFLINISKWYYKLTWDIQCIFNVKQA